MIVVDSSVLVDALLSAPETDALRAQLAIEDLHAPSLLDYEVVSALRSLVLGRRLSPARAGDALTDLDDLLLERWPCIDSLRRRVIQLHRTVSAYDAAYVALAEALECPLVTRDRKLAKTRGHDARIQVW